jgi:hypothetical protein
MQKFFFALSLVFLISLKCQAARIAIAPADNRVSIPDVITIYSEWIKDKGNKYDLNLTINNAHQKGIIVLLKEMHCFRGAVEGELKHTFFNTGERTIDFKRGQSKSMTLVCHLKSKGEGNYRIVLDQVYENASGDRKTIGKELAKAVDWHVRIAAD